MDDKRYYRLLLKFRDEGIRFRPFMGRRWFAVKGLVLVASVAFISIDDPITRGVGLVLLGFASGTIAVDVRSYVTTKRYWPCQREVLNWDKIEALSKETP